MRKIFFGLLLLNLQIAHAQSTRWFAGSLVTANDEVLVGKIALEDKYDLVLFQQEGSGWSIRHINLNQFTFMIITPM